MEVTRKIANLQLKGKRRYFVLLVFWKQRFVCVVLAVLELALYQPSLRLRDPPVSGIKDVCHSLTGFRVFKRKDEKGNGAPLGCIWGVHIPGDMGHGTGESDVGTKNNTTLVCLPSWMEVVARSLG